MGPPRSGGVWGGRPPEEIGRASKERRGPGARPCGPPVFSSSMVNGSGRDGRNDWTMARATMVCRAQQPQS